MASSLSRKINILEVNSSLSYAGGQRNMVTYAKYLRRDIFDVTVAAYQTGGQLEVVLTDLNIPYLIAHGNIDAILSLIEEKSIDVIHIHRSGGVVPIETELLLKAKKNKPNLVIVEKNVFGKYDQSLAGIFDASLFQSMMHVNERFLPKSGQEFDFDFHKVFYNLVDGDELERYRETPENIAKFKTDLHIGPQDYVVGKVARPVLEKWSDLIIEMVPFLVKQVPNVKVVIVGCPQSRIRRIQKGCYKEYFRFIPETSNQPDLFRFYQTIDVLAHSSKIGECNGNVINEAMYWKKPVVVNSTPRKDNGQLEQVEHMVNGIIANSPPTFARAVASVLTDTALHQAMGEAGYNQVQANNKPELLTARLEKVFIEKLAKSGHMVGLQWSEKYARLEYQPDAETIKKYKREYRIRLNWDFGRMTVGEKLWYLFTMPRRLYWKIIDFIVHKYQSYVK